MCFEPEQSGTTTTTQVSQPWAAQRKYLKYGFNQALNRYKWDPQKYFPGDEVANLNPTQLAAFERMRGHALDKWGVNDQARNQFSSTLRGDYMKPESNPWLKATVDAAVWGAMGGVDTNASRAGAYGSSDWQFARTKTAGDISRDITYQNYGAERDRQLRAMGFAPTLDAMEHNDLNLLLGIGDRKQNLAQQEIEARKRAWQFQQEEPWTRLERYMRLVQGNYGGTSTASQPYYSPSTASQVLGGLSAAGGLASGLCCFIFIAAHDGVLHPVARRYRDEHMTERNRRGYYWLADRLVPLMERYEGVKEAVKWLMVEPMIAYGKYHYGEGKIGRLFAPVAKTWLKVFDWLGRRGPYRRLETDEVV